MQTCMYNITFGGEAGLATVAVFGGGGGGASSAVVCGAPGSYTHQEIASRGLETIRS